MNGINKVIIIGSLGADPDIRATQAGKTVANMSVATSEKWRDKNSGEQKESTTWHRVLLFDRVAEIARDYLRKGSPVYIEGKLQTRKWQDRDGNDRYTTEIVGRDMQMLGGKNPNQGGDTSLPAASTASEDEVFPDDIPF